jgi:hypothetical protein
VERRARKAKGKLRRKTKREGKPSRRSLSMFGIFWYILRDKEDFERLTRNQCEKHGKKEEALEKLKAGASFDSVAKEFSEDKARVGMV